MGSSAPYRCRNSGYFELVVLTLKILQRTRSASPSDQLQEGRTNDLWRPGSILGKNDDHEDGAYIRCLFPGVLKTYGPLIATPAPQARQKYELSSLGVRRSHRAASPVAPIFSPVTSSFKNGRKTLDRAKPSGHNSAERNHGPLSNPKKRARKASETEDINPPEREFSVLRDEILEYPSKKRRVSSHLVRESVSQKYNAKMGSTKRRGNSSMSKTSSGASSRRLSLHKSGPFVKNKATLLETTTPDSRLDTVNPPTRVSTDYAGYLHTAGAQSNESLEMLTVSDTSIIQKFRHSPSPSKFRESRKSSQPRRRSARLIALQQELADQLPLKEEQHPEVTNATIATSPEGVSFEASSHCFGLAGAKRSQAQKAYSEGHQQPRLSKRQTYGIYMKLYT